MGQTARIYALSQQSYCAALAGNPADFMIEPTVEALDLDKAWHAIHFVVTGDASLTFMLSGTQIACVSEHCEVHSPESIAALHAGLSARTIASIMSSFQPAQFSDLKIYPDAWSAEMAPYLTQHLEQFIRKLKEIAGLQLAMLVIIQ